MIPIINIISQYSLLSHHLKKVKITKPCQANLSGLIHTKLAVALNETPAGGQGD